MIKGATMGKVSLILQTDDGGTVTKSLEVNPKSFNLTKLVTMFYNFVNVDLEVDRTSLDIVLEDILDEDVDFEEMEFIDQINHDPSFRAFIQDMYRDNMGFSDETV